MQETYSYSYIIIKNKNKNWKNWPASRHNLHIYSFLVVVGSKIFCGTFSTTPQCSTHRGRSPTPSSLIICSWVLHVTHQSRTWDLSNHEIKTRETEREREDGGMWNLFLIFGKSDKFVNMNLWHPANKKHKIYIYMELNIRAVRFSEIWTNQSELKKTTKKFKKVVGRLVSVGRERDRWLQMLKFVMALAFLYLILFAFFWFFFYIIIDYIWIYPSIWRIKCSKFRVT